MTKKLQAEADREVIEEYYKEQAYFLQLKKQCLLLFPKGRIALSVELKIR